MDKTDNQELFKKIENFKYKKLKHLYEKDVNTANK